MLRSTRGTRFAMFTNDLPSLLQSLLKVKTIVVKAIIAILDKIIDLHMSKLYRSREGEATAVDTKTQLTTLGSESAPGPLLVPAGAKKLIGVIVAAIGNMAAATGYSAFIRLEGPGLIDGPETLAVMAGGQAVATGGNAAIQAQEIDLDLDVIPANEIQIFGEMAGTDIGQTSFVVTLIFQL